MTPQPKHLPDFIVIGAMKCGTSSLAAQLGAQAGVFMTTPKEPNYFSNDEVFEQGSQWYAELFAQTAPGQLCGEASTHYTKLPTYPQTVDRIARAFEHPPRFVYLIRDPVVRAVSHYIHEWSTGLMGSDITQAFGTHNELVSYGCYAQQIAPYVERFGRDSIYLSSLETLKAAPQTELERICAHIGHTGPVQWENELGQQNVSAERVRPLPAHKLLVDNPVATVLRRGLVPKFVRTWLRKSRSMTKRPELPQALRTELQDRFLKDREELAMFFKGNRALIDAYPFAKDAHAA